MLFTRRRRPSHVDRQMGSEGLVHTWRERARRLVCWLWQRLTQSSIPGLAAWLTLVLFAIFWPGPWYCDVGGALLCLPGLFSRRCLQNPAYWFLVAACAGGCVAWSWFSADNHKYLMTYWALGSRGMVGVEFLTNLDQLPEKSYFLFAPVKIRDCHGGPGRAIALY